MRRRLGGMAAAVAAAVVLLLVPSSALAYATFGDHILIGGVGNYGANNRLYVIFDGAAPYTSTIHSAMYDWIHTTERLGITTPISWVETSSESAGTMEIHASGWAPQSTGYIAVTEMWTGSKSNGTRIGGLAEGAPTANWNWCKIRINTNVYDVNSMMAANGHTASYNRKGSVAHEMGHCMGLAHVTNTAALMSTLAAGRTTNNARANECNGINHLY